MTYKVVLYHPIASRLREQLASHFDVTAFDAVNDANRAEFIAAVNEADGIIGMGLPVPTQAVLGAKRLKVIATISAGFDKFDVPALTAHKIVLLNLNEPL